MTNTKLTTGQSLIEVIIAIVIVGLIAIGLVRVSSLSLKNARYANEETEAVALAEKKIAELKASAVNDDTFWSTLTEPRETGVVNDYYCYLVRVVNNKGELPTETPSYNDADMVLAKVFVYWGLKLNKVCSSEAMGAINYDHNVEIDTTITK